MRAWIACSSRRSRSSGGVGRRAGVGPRSRPGVIGRPSVVEAEQAVPEGGGRHRGDVAAVGGGAVEHAGDAAQQRVGLELAGPGLLDPRRLPERRAVALPQRRAQRRRADVEDDDHRSLKKFRPSESSACWASMLSRVSSPGEQQHAHRDQHDAGDAR